MQGLHPSSRNNASHATQSDSSRSITTSRRITVSQRKPSSMNTSIIDFVANKAVRILLLVLALGAIAVVLAAVYYRPLEVSTDWIGNANPNKIECYSPISRPDLVYFKISQPEANSDLWVLWDREKNILMHPLGMHTSPLCVALIGKLGIPLSSTEGTPLKVNCHDGGVYFSNGTVRARIFSKHH
jgi:hypothetical protein